MDGHSLKLKFKPIRTRDEGTHESCTGQVLSEDAEEDKAVSECPSTRTALYSSTDYQWHSPFTQPLDPQTFQTHSLMDNMCKADTGDIEGSEEYFRDVMGGTLGTQDQPYNRLPPVQVFGCSVPRVYSFQQLYGYRDWETSTPMWMTQGTRDSRSYGSTDYSSMTSAVQPLQPDDHSSTLRTDHSSTSTLRTDHTFNHSGSLRWTLLQNENGTNTISSIPSYPTSQIPVYKPPDLPPQSLPQNRLNYSRYPADPGQYNSYEPHQVCSSASNLPPFSASAKPCAMFPSALLYDHLPNTTHSPLTTPKYLQGENTEFREIGLQKKQQDLNNNSTDPKVASATAARQPSLAKILSHSQPSSKYLQTQMVREEDPLLCHETVPPSDLDDLPGPADKPLGMSTPRPLLSPISPQHTGGGTPGNLFPSVSMTEVDINNNSNNPTLVTMATCSECPSTAVPCSSIDMGYNYSSQTTTISASEPASTLHSSPLSSLPDPPCVRSSSLPASPMSNLPDPPSIRRLCLPVTVPMFTDKKKKTSQSSEATVAVPSAEPPPPKSARMEAPPFTAIKLAPVQPVKTDKKTNQTAAKTQASKPNMAHDKKKTNPLQPKAVELMSTWFKSHMENPYPSREEKEWMADKGNISINQVNSWFANKRNRTNTTRPKKAKRQIESQISSLCNELMHPNKKPNMDNSYVIAQLSSILTQTGTKKRHSRSKKKAPEDPSKLVPVPLGPIPVPMWAQPLAALPPGYMYTAPNVFQAPQVSATSSASSLQQPPLQRSVKTRSKVAAGSSTRQAQSRAADQFAAANMQQLLQLRHLQAQVPPFRNTFRHQIPLSSRPEDALRSESYVGSGNGVNEGALNLHQKSQKLDQAQNSPGHTGQLRSARGSPQKGGQKTSSVRNYADSAESSAVPEMSTITISQGQHEETINITAVSLTDVTLNTSTCADVFTSGSVEAKSEVEVTSTADVPKSSDVATPCSANTCQTSDDDKTSKW